MASARIAFSFSAARRRSRLGAAPMLAPALAMLGCGMALAAPVPAGDVGASTMQQHLDQLQQLNQQTNAAKQQGDVVVTAPSNRAGLPKPGGPTVLLKSVSFTPSVFLTPAELDAIIAPYVGHRLDFAGISRLVRDVNDLYAKKGIVTASAILPPQKLSDGNLKVELVEGKVGSVAIVGAHNTSDKYILDRLHLATNGVVDVPRAAHDITYFNKTNQAQLRLQLQPGATFGLTDLALGVTEPPSNTLQFFVDNEGVPSTGAFEFGTYYRGYDLLHIDDNLTLYATKSAGSLAGTVSYDAPVTTSGTRVAGSYTRSVINVVDGPTAPLDITGNSQAVSLTVSQPLIATTDWTVLASLSGVYGNSTSDSASVPLVHSETIKGVAGLSVSYAADGRSFSFNPQLIYAHANNLILGTNADIVLAAGTINGSFKLNKDFSISATGAFQYSNTQLLPGDLLFQIGGPNTVRGYQADGVAGDSGYFAEVELHHDFSNLVEGMDGFVFTDFGQVYSTFPAVTSLASVGAGVSFTLPNQVTAEFSAGVPVIDALAGQPAFSAYARLVAHAF
jgi:hemolysin activation/secretion protein